jgi:hypothetical protein
VPVLEGKRGKRKSTDDDPAHPAANDSGGSEWQELDQDVAGENEHSLHHEWQTVANVNQQDVADDED